MPSPSNQRQTSSPSPSPAPGLDSTWGPAADWGRTAQSDWSLDDVRQFLSGYEIAPTRLAAAPLPGGWENLNLLLDVDGRRLVLRRYDSTDPAEVPWEIALLTHLAAHHFPTPAPLRRTDGAFLTPFHRRPAAVELATGPLPRVPSTPAPTATTSFLIPRAACSPSLTSTTRTSRSSSLMSARS